MAKVYVMVHLETFYIDHYIDQQADKKGRLFVLRHPFKFYSFVDLKAIRE